MKERQVKLVNRQRDGLEGKLTTAKRAKNCKTSQPTALRSINDLIEKSFLVKADEGSKKNSYVFAQ